MSAVALKVIRTVIFIWLAATGAVFAQAPPGKPTSPMFDHPVGKGFLFPDFVRPAFEVQYPGHVVATFDLTYAAVTGARRP